MCRHSRTCNLPGFDGSQNIGLSRTRTYDRPLRRRVLYPLSYQSLKNVNANKIVNSHALFSKAVMRHSHCRPFSCGKRGQREASFCIKLSASTDCAWGGFCGFGASDKTALDKVWNKISSRWVIFRREIISSRMAQIEPFVKHADSRSALCRKLVSIFADPSQFFWFMIANDGLIASCFQ